jgi:hypothetical protein
LFAEVVRRTAVAVLPRVDDPHVVERPVRHISVSSSQLLEFAEGIEAEKGPDA